ncbi:hypothetical protein BGX38DRAFT_1276679 [Terfezia claveryi]|nr:hypothetical protein BGX38DRAFT_1276679 [Terfezia claveryi]
MPSPHTLGAERTKGPKEPGFTRLEKQNPAPVPAVTTPRTADTCIKDWEDLDRPIWIEEEEDDNWDAVEAFFSFLYKRMMGRKKAVSAAPQDVHLPSSQARSQIAWAGKLDTSLALLMKNNWSTYQSCRSKMDWYRKWAEKLGILHQDPSGEKTKAHVAYIWLRVTEYSKAKELLRQTGAGTKIREYKVGVKVVREELTLDQQVEKLCPAFDARIQTLIDFLQTLPHGSCYHSLCLYTTPLF